MNKQREAVYGLRNQLLKGLDQKELIADDYVSNLLSAMLDEFAPEKIHPDQWDVNGIKKRLTEQFGLNLEAEGIDIAEMNRHELGETLFEKLKEHYAAKETIIGEPAMRYHERMIMLSVLDGLWKDHLLSMDHLKEGIGLRGYAQQDPLVAYKRESFDMFEAMMNRFQEDTVRFLFLMQIIGPDGQPVPVSIRPRPAIQGTATHPAAAGTRRRGRCRRKARRTSARADTDSHPPAHHHHRPDRSRIPAQEKTRTRTHPHAPALHHHRPDRGRVPAQEKTRTRPGPHGRKQRRPGNTQRRTGDKVGRNDPCPCGSGKKYKKCHGAEA